MKDADKTKWMSAEDRRNWVKVSGELRALERTIADLQVNVDEAAEELVRGERNLIYNPGPASEALLVERRAEFQSWSGEVAAAFEALEAAKTRLLADPVLGAMAAFEIAELEKRVKYRSSQGDYRAARGAAVQGELRYRLKEMGLVDGGLGNAVYCAELVSDGHISAKRLEEEIAQQAGMRPSQVKALMWALDDVVQFHLRGNRAVSVGGMFVVSPTLRGTCTAAEVQKELMFKPYVTVKTTSEFQKRFRTRLAVRRTADAREEPRLDAVTKLRMTNGSDVIGPGSLVLFTGERLDYNPAQEDEGIFLYPKTDRAIEYRMQHLGNRKDYLKRRKVTVELPETLPWGTVYRVEFRRRLSNSSQLRVYAAPFELDFPPA